jgi:hypothetical protein
MEPDPLKQAWQAQAAQTRLVVDAERVLAEVRRNERSLTAALFWRDVREVGVSLLLVPLWIYLGITLSLPWMWYLTVPVLLWIGGFLLVDRLRHSRRPPEPGEPLLQCVERSLSQVEHQIWLLRNIAWWYLLPLAVAALAFVGHVAWDGRSFGWLTALVTAVVVAVVGMVFAGVYWLNQTAVRSALEPRRWELHGLLASLKDSPPDTGESSK